MTGRVMRKRGFTLIETVVTVGIVAAMAAVVVPQVVKQFDASDTTSLQQDLKNLQTAIETFRVNTRGLLPGDLDDLANPVQTNADITLALDTALTASGTRSVFGTTTTLWEGPYIDFSFLEGGTKISGYGATIEDNFVCYEAEGDNSDNTPATGIGTTVAQICPDIDATDRLFLAIRILGLGDASDARFQAINDLIDGTGESTRETQGRIRLVSISSVNTVFYLASPLN